MGTQKLYPGFLNPLLGASRHTLPKHVAVIGAGTIGPDIGYYLKSSLPDSRLTLIDIEKKALAGALERYKSYAEKGVKRGKMSEETAARVLDDIVTSTDYGALATADLVIEAASESIPIKRKIFSMVEEQVGRDAIIGSNTSSIPASVIFSDVVLPGRTCITHFFSPAWRNPAVELVSWEKADRATVDYLRWLFCYTGKTPVVVDDAVAFIFSRMFDNWCNEAAMLLDDATAAQIDKVSEEFVHAGPFFVLNLAHGNPIIVEANDRQADAEGEHYRPAHIFNSVETWHTPKPGSDLEVPPEIAASIRDRLLGILFSQTLDSLARDMGTAQDINLISCLALGFRRGPLDIMADIGELEVERILRRLAIDRPGLPSEELVPTVHAALDFNRAVLVDRLEGGDVSAGGAGDVIVLTIRRPAQLNALTDDVLDELLAVITEHEEDPGVAGFVITGFGVKAFCAGGDVSRFPEMLGDTAASERYARQCSCLLEYMDGMTKPVVAAVNGIALGGGAELAIRCHDRVASPHAVFQFPEVTLGLLPGIGGLIIPYRKWPHAADTFDRMLLEGTRLSSLDALEIGVVTAVEEEYEALVRLAAGRVRDLAGSVPLEYPALGVVANRRPVSSTGVAGLPQEVVAIIAEAIGEGMRASGLQAALNVGYEAFGRVAVTRAAREGVGAFMSGRKPDYEGM